MIADLASYVSAIDDAHRNGRLLTPITDVVDLSLANAYVIQRLLLERRLERGERQVGWKIGYSSTAMREQMGVQSPNFGPLTDVMALVNGAYVSPRLVQPRVEPEILVVVREPIGPRASRKQVAAHVEVAAAALEVVDSVWEGYRFRLEDNTADGSSAAHFVVGDVLPTGEDLATLPVELLADGRPIARSRGSAALGHPYDAVAWLADELDRYGLHLSAGDHILTGGLTAAAPLGEGMTITGSFGGQHVVAVSRHRSQRPEV